MLDPLSPIPLYHQLAELLRGAIVEGSLAPGERLPSETVLAQIHGIGRPTVRQATESLVRAGLLERRRGSGTYVRDAKARVELFSPLGTLRAFDDAGVAVAAETLSAPRLVEHDVHGTAFEFVRLVKSEEGPVVIETFWFDALVFADLPEHDLEGRSLAKFVTQVYRLELLAVHQSFRAIEADELNARRLQVKVGNALLAVHRKLEFARVGAVVAVEVVCKTTSFSMVQSISGSQLAWSAIH
jgi:GntR family transcriptional regulator